MKKISTMLFVVLAFTLLSQCTQAGPIDSALDEARNEGRLVMLELGSVGCIPCEQMKPVMVRLSDVYKGKMDVIFIDVRKDHDMARRFGVFVIPVQVFLDKNGKEFHRHAGFYSYEEIEAMLRKTGL